jgi:4-hydroxythreonine-4-phosphate dehydrogenase
VAGRIEEKGLHQDQLNNIMNNITVGVTMGDPSGIGPAVSVKALRALRGKADIVVIGDAWVLGVAERALGVKVSKCQSVKIVDLKNVPRKGFVFGKISKDYGRASVEYLDKAMELLAAGEIDCLVTAPISKQSVKLSGFRFPGHTEYLAARTGTKDHCMMLLNDKMKFSLLTVHMPLNKVSQAISRDSVRKNISLTARSLRDLFGIKSPRIVVCGLNPHASDSGIIGKEEGAVFMPALKDLRRSLNAVIIGPVSADVAILKASRNEFDAVIVAYHDQALIPLKLTGYGSGVNITLGLPFVRTSPLHGTAFDIAAKPELADASSMIAAIKTAIQCELFQRKA